MADALVALICGTIGLYRRGVSPLLGPVCRFEPSCSVYTHQALKTWGLARGLGLGLRRLTRCHPWHVGGPDPVPERVLEEVKFSGKTCWSGVAKKWRNSET